MLYATFKTQVAQAQEKQKVVLEAMVRENKISEAQMNEIVGES